jgi:hypothetical protein
MVSDPYLRSESVDASVEERHFAHVLCTQHYHEHAGEAKAVAAVRRTAVAEEVQIVLDRLKREPLLLVKERLCTKFIRILLEYNTNVNFSPESHFQPLCEYLQKRRLESA